MAPAFESRPGRILYIDAYDSFANNIVALIEIALDAKVFKIHIDDDRFWKQDEELFINFLKGFDAVVAGPGPGTVNNEKDVGLIQRLWSLDHTKILPVLGICLGFQSLTNAFGATNERLTVPRHGIISEVLHKGRSIFSGVKGVKATQYHSLHANIGHAIQTRRAVSYPGELWLPSKTCPFLEPLAWDFDNAQNGPVLMAVRHTEKPFWGVQFHPESICTDEEAVKIVQNWWTDAQVWIREQLLVRRKSEVSTLGLSLKLSDFNSLKFHWNGTKSRRHSQYSLADTALIDPPTLAHLMTRGDSDVLPDLPSDTVHASTCGSGRIRVKDVCEVLKIPDNEAIVLESCLKEDLLPLNTGTGRWSIIGLVIPGETLRLHYYTKDRRLQLRTGKDELYLETEVSDIWAYLKALMEHLKPRKQPAGPTFAPFWGGLMGYVSYEAGLETIGVEPSSKHQGSAIPDICFAFITRSIVFDHKVKKIYVQSIRGDDAEWVSTTVQRIFSTQATEESRIPETESLRKAYVKNAKPLLRPSQPYQEAVARCQEYIVAGDSYELCLTGQDSVRCPKIPFDGGRPVSWSLYRELMRRNPAPFSAYIQLGRPGYAIQILSSSPERFMSWDRNGCSQCRPIKGTVKKSDGMTRDMAKAILSTSKERAENLMIVDLVRHQLHGVYGAGNVHVSKLMQVEEYETLYQLVSVIEGIPPGAQKAKTPEDWEVPPDYVSGKKHSSDIAGIDALSASLPPGSMTGAPKKRSCELLKEVEGDLRRGIYSGILGYLDVGGGGDFSVVIRTMVKTEDETEVVELPSGETKECEVWRIGAGGAVTAQSTPEGEWAEMVAKSQSAMQVFRDDGPKKKTAVDTRVLRSDIHASVGI